MITHNLNPEIWVISDPHLIASSLHDNGQAFSRMQKTSQGKDLYYQETALTAFARMAQAKKPAAIAVTGDVTFNGERESAEKFAQIFKSLKETKLLVLPGNHDIFDGWAREFRGKKQFYAGQISPLFWKSIFAASYRCALNKDPHSLAYTVQLNPDYLLILLDSNYYGREETTTAPFTKGAIRPLELKWLEKQLRWAGQNHLRPLLFMHHNLYVHNPAVNKGYVLDNAQALRQICARYQVKLLFSGHIHAQNILGPQGMTPTTEIVTSSFCTSDQGYGVIRLHHRHLTYVRKSFAMKPYLSSEEKKNYTLTHFHDYLTNLQMGTIAASLMQYDLRHNHDDLDLVRKIGRLFAQMNYNFFTGHDQVKKEKLLTLHQSRAYQTLIKQHPKLRSYLRTLYDTSGHNNLECKIHF